MKLIILQILLEMKHVRILNSTTTQMPSSLSRAPRLICLKIIRIGMNLDYVIIYRGIHDCILSRFQTSKIFETLPLSSHSQRWYNQVMGWHYRQQNRSYFSIRFITTHLYLDSIIEPIMHPFCRSCWFKLFLNA